MKAFFRVKAILDRIVDAVAIVLLAFLTATVFVAIVFRYVFNLPLAWSEEASRFSFIWMTLLGSAICLRDRGHLGIDLLAARLPDPWRRLVTLVNDLVVGVIAAIIFVFGLKLFAVARLQLSPAIGIPMTVVYAALPLGAFFMLIELLANFLAGRSGPDLS